MASFGRSKLGITGQGNDVIVNAEGQLHVVLMGFVDEGNSSQDILGVDGIFQGVGKDTLDYGFIFVTVFSDVGSVVDGLQAQVRSDEGSTWRTADVYTIPAGTEKTFAFQPNKRFFRIKYTNGGVGQGVFDLHVLFKKTASLPSSHRIQDSISDEDDSRLVKAVLSAKNPSGTFVNISATTSDNLRVTDAESGLAIAKGDVTNTTFIHKFGLAADVDIADGFVDIWDGTGLPVPVKTYTYSTTDDITYISSSDAGDNQDVQILGLDIDFLEVTQVVALTGQVSVALGTPLIRVFRMVNQGTVDIAGIVYCHLGGATTGGVPNTASDIRAAIDNGNNQTLMALYTIPAGKTGYMRDWYAAIANRTAAACVVHLDARPFGEVFQLKHVSAINSLGTGYIQHEYSEPEVFLEKTDIVMHADSGVNNVAVAAGFDIVLIDN